MYKLFSTIAVSTLIGLGSCDTLTLFSGPSCEGAYVSTYSPLKRGAFGDMGSARSFTLVPDNGTIYHMRLDKQRASVTWVDTKSNCSCHSATGTCSIYATDWSPGKSNRTLGSFADFDEYGLWKLARAAPQQQRKRRDEVSTRDLGATMVCGNTPYFLQVSQTSSTQADLSADEESNLEASFSAAADAARPRGREIEAEAVGDQGETLVLRMSLTDDTIDGIVPSDVDEIISTLFEFRDQQRGGIDFSVNLYTGRPDAGAGIVGGINFFIR